MDEKSLGFYPQLKAMIMRNILLKKREKRKTIAFYKKTTAPMDTYKQENGSTTHLIGQDWQKLIDIIESRAEDSDIKSFDGGGSLFQYRAEDSVLRTLQDVKRLRQKDMPLFGRCPETDNFYTVVCSLCSMILMPFALKDHWEKRHGDNKSYSPSDKQNVESPGKVKTKKLTPVKLEKVDKSKKIKSNPLPETPTEEVFKDSKKVEKSKKGKPGDGKTVEPESPSTKSGEKGKTKGSRFTPDLQPIVALSPIQVAESESEGNENKDLKSKKREKKKNDRKADKVYDPDKHCGVINDVGKPCVRSILCKVHQVALKRAVANRTMPYDMLIRVLRSQNDEEKIKAESGSLRLIKVEPSDKTLPEGKEPQRMETVVPGVQSNNVWTSDQISIKTEEPPVKRLKIKKEIVEEDVDQSQFTLPSHLEALIDETLKTLKDVDETEVLPIIPVVPKSEPLLKWSFEPEIPRKSPSPPPHIVLDDIHWHSSHPKPLATNTFGCRLIGGLMSTCKKLDILRKHLQSVWASSASSPPPIRSGYNDVYNSNNPQNTNSSNANSKSNLVLTKYVKRANHSKGGTVVKKNVAPVLSKNSAVKRKRRSNSNVISPIQTSNASDIISGLVINSVPVQRTGSSSVPAIPTGVIPVNSITGNGVPLRLFQGSLPVIASATHNQPATFIHLNLCPPK